MTIRLAVTGAGIMGSDHARIFAQDLPGASIRVVCDASEPRARALADAVGGADVMTDPQAEQAAGQRHSQLGFMRRFDQSYAEMTSALNSCTLGRALMMHNFHRNVEPVAADFTGAMAITKSAAHEFGLVRDVLGTDYAAISAFPPKRSDALVASVFVVLQRHLWP